MNVQRSTHGLICKEVFFSEIRNAVIPFICGSCSLDKVNKNV